MAWNYYPLNKKENIDKKISTADVFIYDQPFPARRNSEVEIWSAIFDGYDTLTDEKKKEIKISEMFSNGEEIKDLQKLNVLC